MISWKDLTVQQERYQDFTREIEADRLARLATAGGEGRPFHARTLTWLGVSLSALGESLQRRYGHTVPAQDTRRSLPSRLVMLVPTPVPGKAASARVFIMPTLSARCEEDQQAPA